MGQITELTLSEKSSETVYIQPKVNDSILFLIAKRIIDFVLATVLLMLTAPIVVAVIVCIKMDSSGPAFYVQDRVGYRGREFKLIKLRSMVMDAEKDGPRWAAAHDERVTKVGQFIRKTRVDELPQLIHVIKGEMSLIGPRPERNSFMQKFNQEIPGFMNRVLVKPGLTGWAQVNGGYDLTPEEKFQHDMYYITNPSVRMETKIFLKTITVVLTGKGAR
ncbi:sugar transferase [Paenibacillus arenosi]|uniref:Sugar transferase n=1 Tax=Paenibacillus arenosi TaxID=2774142 RepID=A0ABR9AW45_9BACL|nr:sugar transferase [Paenibacillus arenosi]MBD8498330.1 sugar transferase [Paenibacillus arenosi]